MSSRIFTCRPFVCLQARIDVVWQAFISPHLVTQLFLRQEKCSVTFDLGSTGSLGQRARCLRFPATALEELLKHLDGRQTNAG